MADFSGDIERIALERRSRHRGSRVRGNGTIGRCGVPAAISWSFNRRSAHFQTHRASARVPTSLRKMGIEVTMENGIAGPRLRFAGAAVMHLVRKVVPGERSSVSRDNGEGSCLSSKPIDAHANGTHGSPWDPHACSGIGTGSPR